MLLWFADLMNVTEEVTIDRPNVSTLLSSAFIGGDLNAATRGPNYRTSMIFTIFGKPNRIHGESMNAYHSRLHQLASTCEFAN